MEPALVKTKFHIKAPETMPRQGTIGAPNWALNPLTPVPPVTAGDEPRPFFLFWRHHFWPKLASPVLNFCRRKRSFQWCPDQSDWPNGALDMLKKSSKKAQKVEWKTQSKISCHLFESSGTLIAACLSFCWLEEMKFILSLILCAQAWDTRSDDGSDLSISRPVSDFQF